MLTNEFLIFLLCFHFFLIHLFPLRINSVNAFRAHKCSTSLCIRYTQFFNRVRDTKVELEGFLFLWPIS
jgi:hypothetical protein